MDKHSIYNDYKVCDFCLVKSKDVCYCLPCKSMGKHNLFCNKCYLEHIKHHHDGECSIITTIKEETYEEMKFLKDISKGIGDDNTSLF